MHDLRGGTTMNPVSAISGATGDRVLAGLLVLAFCAAASPEAAAHWRRPRPRGCRRLVR
jgi:2-dehydropantoate 2-reductase